MSAYSDAVRRMGAVAHWPLDDAAGTAATEIVGGITSTYTGSYVLVGKNARVGHSNGVDLTGGYVAVSDVAALETDASLGRMTLVGWINPDSVSLPAMMLWSKFGQWQWRIEADGSMLMDFMNLTGSSSLGSAATAAASMSAGTKYMAIARYDSTLATKLAIGWNGNWSRATGNPSQPSASGYGAFIGTRSNDLAGSKFDGGMQDFSYFDRYLSNAELDYLYATGQSTRAGVVY